MPTIEQLEQALVKAHRAGDQRAIKLILSDIQKGASAEEWAGEPLDEMGTGSNVLGGLKHAWDKAAYGLEGAVKGIFGRDIDQEHQKQLDQGKAFVEHQGGGAKVGEFAGDVLPYAATGAGAIRAGLSLPLSMLAQGATGATVTPGDLNDRASAGMWGAAGEGAGQLLMKSLGRLAGGVKNMTPEARTMVENGVYPTYGGLKGGAIKGMEDALTSVPGVGDGIIRGRNQAIVEMNQAANNMGGLPIKVDAGEAGQKQLQDYFKGAFEDATGNLKFDINDPAFLQAIDEIKFSQRLNKDGIAEIDNFFDVLRKNTNTPKPRKPGTGMIFGNRAPQPPQYMSGKDFHAMLQDMRAAGGGFRTSNSEFDRRLGEAYKDLYNAADNQLNNFNSPEAVEAFRNVRQQYKASVPSIKAAGSNVVGRNMGIFTPTQLHTANWRNATKEGRAASLRAGTDKTNTFAQDAVHALGTGLADSGSAKRVMAGYLAGGGLSYLNPMTLMSIPASYALNSNIGRRYLAGALPRQQAIAEALRSKAGIAGAAGAGLLGQTQNDF